MKTLDQAIEEIVADIAKLEAQIREKKTTVNTLCEVAKRERLYQLDKPEQVVPTHIRSDQFYGQPLASAVRTILDMRKQQNLGAATNNEIYDVLKAGGYQFRTKSEDVARASLRNSLSKNTVTFHKLHNGRFGLLSWYPNVKTGARISAAVNGTDIEEEDDAPTVEQPTAEA